MQELATWEMLLLGVLVILLMFWFMPGLKAQLKQSQEAEKDWKALLIPLAAVVGFIIILLALV